MSTWEVRGLNMRPPMPLRHALLLLLLRPNLLRTRPSMSMPMRPPTRIRTRVRRSHPRINRRMSTSCSIPCNRPIPMSIRSRLISVHRCRIIGSHIRPRKRQMTRTPRRPRSYFRFTFVLRSPLSIGLSPTSLHPALPRVLTSHRNSKANPRCFGFFSPLCMLYVRPVCS